MSARRRRSPVAISSVPRCSLDNVHHKDIDAILKHLRVCSRRLREAMDSFTDELRALERLYYKCKNQHRMALFFKRVPEIRRYGRRLSELDILERVDLLRAAFVGLENTNNHKALRNSWSHLPESPYVYFVTERLTACSTLVCKMRERLENAYHHFALAMQSGAFVQLIILFVAISSRMTVLSAELQEALQLGISTCNRLLVIIHPTGQLATTSQQSSAGPETSRPSEIDPDVRLEDVGKPVSRCETIDTSISVVEGRSVERETTLELRITPPPACPIAGDRTTKKATMKVAQKSRLKKAKRKLDEIDEIFGF